MMTKEEINKKTSQKDEEIKTLKNTINKLKDFYEKNFTKIFKQNENWKKIVLNLSKKIHYHNTNLIENEKNLSEQIEILIKKAIESKQIDDSSINKEIKKEIEKENLFKNSTFSIDNQLKEIFGNFKENKNLKDLIINKSSLDIEKEEKNIISGKKNVRNFSENEKKENMIIQNKIKSVIYPKENKNNQKKFPETNFNSQTNSNVKGNSLINNNLMSNQEPFIDNSIIYNINAINETTPNILKISKTKNFKNLGNLIKNNIDKIYQLVEEESKKDIFMEFILPELEEYIMRKKVYSFFYEKENFTHNQYINEKIFVKKFNCFENIKIKIIKKEDRRINVIANAIENFFSMYIKRKDEKGNLIIKGILNKPFEKFEKFFKGKKNTLDYCSSIKVEVYLFKWDLFYDYDFEKYTSSFDLKDLKKFISYGGLLKETRKYLRNRNLMIEGGKNK